MHATLIFFCDGYHAYTNTHAKMPSFSFTCEHDVTIPRGTTTKRLKVWTIDAPSGFAFRPQSDEWSIALRRKRAPILTSDSVMKQAFLVFRGATTSTEHPSLKVVIRPNRPSESSSTMPTACSSCLVVPRLRDHNPATEFRQRSGRRVCVELWVDQPAATAKDHTSTVAFVLDMRKKTQDSKHTGSYVIAPSSASVPAVPPLAPLAKNEL